MTEASVGRAAELLRRRLRDCGTAEVSGADPDLLEARYRLWESGEAVRVRVPGGPVLTMTAEAAELLRAEVTGALEWAARFRCAAR